MTFAITQNEADTLLAMEKYYTEAKHLVFPDLGGALRLLLYSKDQHEVFNLDITRGRVLLSKNTFQMRTRKSIILARLDLDGPPHRNPDGEELPCPHLHLFREGWGDKWAFPLPDIFYNAVDCFQTLDTFMDYCNIVEKPIITRGLFT